MRGAIKHIIYDPDPRTLPDNPLDFFNVRRTVGPVDGPGEESFELSVCSQYRRRSRLLGQPPSLPRLLPV
jgi:hypothetical protein